MNLTLRALLLVLAVTSACSQADAQPVAKAAVECQAQTSLNVATIKQQVIVVGELHGNVQTPAFISGLVCSLLKDGRPVLLALEKDGMEQAALNRYLVSAGTDVDRKALLSQGAWTWPMQDGRSGQAMLTLIEDIRRLRSAGHRVGLLAMLQSQGVDMPGGAGVPQGNEADRHLSSVIHERAMADKLAAASAGAAEITVVALAGNIHTATVAGRGDDPQWRSMAQWLLTMRPAFFIGLGSSEGGETWACTERGCGPMHVPRGPLFLTGTQIDAVVNLGPLTASPPAATGFPPARE